MLHRRLSILLLLPGICVIALLGTIAHAQQLAPPPNAIGGGESPIAPELESAPLAAFHRYAHTLHELTDRRRSTVLFPNQQSILRGAQVGFVNVGDGNLTFARRDLVVVGLLPIVIARIYDSSAADGGDFGAGWRLSIAETISPQADGTLLLLDESGSATRYSERNGRYVQVVPHPTDIVSMTRRNGYVLLIKLASGIEKRYRLIDGSYRLTRIMDRNDNAIHLHYRKGRLTQLEGENERAVRIDRDGAGRIAKVTDERGRSVIYEYEPYGRLARVIDLGGNAWAYTYGADGLLSAALDPLGYVDVATRYGDDGRVAEVVHRGRKASYEYGGDTSRVLDHRERVSTFEQNEAGITVTVTNHVGVTTHIVLDAENRVSELHRNEVTKATFLYDEEGRLLSSRQVTDDGLRTIAYAYDGAGRLRTARDDTGDLRLTLRYDPHGNVRLVERGGERTIYRHAANGALEALSRPDGRRYAFETDADGQITKITDQDAQVIELSYLPTGSLERIRFADGTTHTYGYEPSGLRSFIQPSDAKLLRTYYSPSGNMTLLEHVSSTGAIQSDSYEYDETSRLNRVAFERPVDGDVSTSVRELSYDKAGEVVREETPVNDIRFSYDAQDRLVGVADGSKQLIYSYAEDEQDIRLQLDHETQLNPLPWSNSGATIGAAYEIITNRTRLTPYRTVELDSNLDVFRLVSDITTVLPNEAIEDSLARMRLLNLGDATFSDRARFSRPSNVLFVPAEFRWINCVSLPPPPEWCKGVVPPISSFGSIADGPEADLEDNTQCQGGGAGSPCDVRQFRDNEAVRWLRLAPVRMEAFERGAAILCEGGQPCTRRTTSSGADKCRVAINVSNPALAGEHTHPWFEPEDIPAGADGILCDGRIVTEQLIDAQNTANLQFSAGDIARVKSTKKPLYVRASNGNAIRAAEVVDPTAERIMVEQRVVDTL
ncbi:MAG: RHS repeat domain-containing protein [Gammaproteobacteria bacterium]